MQGPVLTGCLYIQSMLQTSSALPARLPAWARRKGRGRAGRDEKLVPDIYLLYLALPTGPVPRFSPRTLRRDMTRL